MSHDVVHLFKSFLTTYLASLVDIPFRSLPHFLLGILFSDSISLYHCTWLPSWDILPIHSISKLIKTRAVKNYISDYGNVLLVLFGFQEKYSETAFSCVGENEEVTSLLSHGPGCGSPWDLRCILPEMEAGKLKSLAAWDEYPFHVIRSHCSLKVNKGVGF